MSVVCMLKTLKPGIYVDVTLTCITYLIKLYQTSESDLSDFDCAMVVGARWEVLYILETPDLVFHTQEPLELCGKISLASGSNGKKNSLM